MAALWPVSFMTDASTSPKLWGWDWAWTAASAAQLRICNGFPLKTPHQVIGFGYNSHIPHNTMPSSGPVSFMTNASTSPKLWALSRAISASQLRICNGFLLKTQHQSIGFGYNSHTPHKSMPSLGPESFMNNASTSPKLWALDRARTAISAQLRSCNGFPLKTPHQIIGFGYNSHTPHETMPSSGPVSFMTKTSTSPKLWALY